MSAVAKRLILIVGRSPVFPFCGLVQRLILGVRGQFPWFLEMLTFPVKNKDLGFWQVRCGNDLSTDLLFVHQLCHLGFSYDKTHRDGLPSKIFAQVSCDAVKIDSVELRDRIVGSMLD